MDHNNENKSPITVYIAEGEKLYKAGDYKKAVVAFTTAIELEPENQMTYVQRSKCYLAMGDAKQALKDAEQSLKQDKNYHRGIYQKAEALYSLGEFEFALVFYHRGQKLRPELSVFRLGVQKAKEAIVNSVGTAKSVNLRSGSDASDITINDNSSSNFLSARKRNTKNDLANRRGTLTTIDIDNKPKNGIGNRIGANRLNSGGLRRTSIDSAAEKAKKQKTAKAVLGEMYPDKAFLMKLLEDKELSKGAVSNGMTIHELIMSGLNYLDTRTDFWQQHKPIYARKRDRALMQQKWKQSEKLSLPESKSQQELLTNFEKAEKCLDEGKPDAALNIIKQVVQTKQIEKHNIENQVHIHSLLGLAQMDIGQHTEALRNHKKELRIAEINNMVQEKSRALDNLGRVYARLGKFDKAIEAWTIKLPLAESTVEKAWLHHELGRCYYELGKCELAVQHGKDSFLNAQTANEALWQINAQVLMAEALEKSDQKVEAKACFDEALALSKFHNDEAAQKAIEKALKEMDLK